MHRFHIQPLCTSSAAAEIIAYDASAVLHTVERMRCGEAHVNRDGVYAFSVRLDDGGLWSPYQRDSIPRSTGNRRVAAALA